MYTCINICIYTHTYTYTYIYTWIHIHIHAHIHVHIHMHIYICICTYMYIYLYIYRICVSCSELEANVYAAQRLSNVHICTCIVLNNTCECLLTLCKNVYGLVHARLYNGAAAPLPWTLLRTYLVSCTNIVQAVVYRLPSCRPPFCWQSVNSRCSLQIHPNPR